VRAVIGIAVPAMSFVLLVAVGLDLTGADFARVRRQPMVVLTGLLAPLVLLPLLAAALISLWPLEPETVAGLLLVAACPVGGMSNVFNYLARSSPALSVALTGLSCLCASVTIPLISAGLELTLGRPLSMSLPIRLVFLQLVAVLAAPLGLGVWIRRRWPALAHSYRPVLQRLSFIGVTGVLFLIVFEDVNRFVADMATTVPLAALFIAGSWLIGWLTAALVTGDSRDRFTIAVEFGTRHIGIATAMAVTVLGRVEFARFGATYFMTEVPLMLLAVAMFRRRHALSLVARPSC
jgi:bile acid:Na+ symporter, BASS family